MRATGILQRQIELDVQDVHVARVRLVFAAVFAGLRSGKLALTSLGRAIAEQTSPKHGIKRVDRLLGNPRLHAERLTFYRAIARRVIAINSRPVILVDWTAVTAKLWALVAAVSFEGRALIVYGETHPISRYLKPRVNAAFLQQLAEVLPPGCVPVIVADAGFRSPFMELVERRGWDFVVRLRGPARIRMRNSEFWVSLPYLFRRARMTATDLGHAEIGPRRRYRCRLVSIRKRVHHRKHKSRVRRGVVVERERRAAREPWILATSLRLKAAKIVDLYARRMQIEETFRDAKSTRFGLSLAEARTHSDRRADVLLLLASITHLFAVMIGVAAETADLQRRFQANTVRHKRVLSIATLGRLVVASRTDDLFRPELVERAWASFQDQTRAAVSM